MFTIQDYIDSLKSDKQKLVTNLTTKGISGLTGEETFTELAPKVLDITPNLQSKSETITTNTTTNISADNGYDGLSSVSITTNVQPNLQSKSETITTNTTTNISADNGYDGLSSVSITTNVQADMSEYFTSSVGLGTNNAPYITKMIKKLNENITYTTLSSDLTKAFIYAENLESLPMINTSSVNSFQEMCAYCSKLTSIPLFDTQSVANMNATWYSCSSLVTIPQFNTSNVSNFQLTFGSCTNLENVPLLNTSSATNLYNTFSGCLKLTDTSLDNILQMCINATSYTGTKTLATLGITNTTYYPASRIQALPHYQDFLDAGWTIGY